MLIEFYIWLDKLSVLKKTSLIVFIIGLAVIIPYYKYVFNLLKNLILKRKLNIISYGFAFTKHDALLALQGNFNENNTKTSFVTEGGKIWLFWNVQNAVFIKFSNQKKVLKGNIIDVTVFKNNNQFDLHVSNIFKTITFSIKIPGDCIKSIDTKKLNCDNILVSKININSYIKTKIKTHPFTAYNPKISFQKNKYLVRQWSLFTPQKFIKFKNSINSKINAQHVSKYYKLRTNNYFNYLYQKQT